MAVLRSRHRAKVLARRAAVLLPLVIAGSVVQPSPARAADNCEIAYVDPYDWVQESCLRWDAAQGLVGEIQAAPYSENGFRPDRVKYCVAYAQLVSSYGTVHTESRSCTYDFQNGAGFGSKIGWGFGRQQGDHYRQYVWLRVTSYAGIVYDSRPYSVRAVVVKPY